MARSRSPTQLSPETSAGRFGTRRERPAKSLGHNLIGNTAGSSGWVSSDLVNMNPLLAPLANYGGPTLTMAFFAVSPALGAGDAAFVTNPPFPGPPPFTDQPGSLAPGTTRSTSVPSSRNRRRRLIRKRPRESVDGIR